MLIPIALGWLLLAGGQAPPEHLRQGLLALQGGDLAKARSELEECVRADPTNSYAWTSLAETYVRSGDPSKASEATAQAEKTADNSPAVSHALAMVYAEIGKFKEAAGREAIFAASPEADGDAASRAAMLYLRAQDFTAAAAAAENGLKTHPRDAQLTLTLGVARYGQRRFDEAISRFLDVVAIDPAIEQPYIFLGKMLDQAGARLPQIIGADRAWLARAPGDARAHLVLAKALLVGDARSAEATTLLETAVKRDANNWEPHYQLGVLLANRHDYRRAADELSRSIELNGREAMPHYHLARVYDRLGEPERAKAEREIHAKLTAGAPADAARK